MKAALLFFLLVHPYQGNLKEDQKSAVHEVLNVLSESSLLGLATKKKYITKVTRPLEGVHPLDFLKEVAQKQNLLENVLSIHKSSSKWKIFIAGLSKSFEEAYMHEDFLDTVKQFCHAVSIDSLRPLQYAEQKDWDSFVKSVVFQIKKR